MREQKANDNGFPVVGKQVKEQQIFPFEQLVEYDGAANKITINANLTINGDTNIGELDIDSGDAPKGQVLTADGDSGASWENRVEYLNLESESGNLTNAQIEIAKQDNVVIQLNGQFYYKNSQSDESIVFKAPAKVVDDDTIAEKVVVDLNDNTYSYSYEVVAAGNSFEPTYDDELDDASTNAPQTKVVYEALEEKANVEDLEQYAKVDGNYPTMTVGLADNLTPYSEESGASQNEPFIYQATGTANGTQPDFATGSYALMKEKRGNSVVVNQHFDLTKLSSIGSHPTSYPFTFNGITFSLSNGKLILNGTATQNTSVVYSGANIKKGNTYIRKNIKSNGLAMYDFYDMDDLSVVVAKYDAQYISLTIREGVSLSNYEYDGFITDLTQWFNGNIPPDILDNPEKFINYYQGDLSYDTGHIENASGRYIKAYGMNQWDEEWESGSINGTTGATQSDGNRIRSKNYIEVIPGQTYYFKMPASAYCFCYDIDKNYISGSPSSIANGTFTVPTNCAFIKFSTGSSSTPITTYNHDISINLYYANEPRCLTYEPFEVLTNTDTGTETLRSAGSVYDSKAPDGTITRRIGVVDLGTLTFEYNSSLQMRTSTGITGLVKPAPSVSTNANIICSTLSTSNFTALVDNTTLLGISLDANDTTRIWLRNGSSTTQPSGWLYYELAEYTEEQGTPYSENLNIDDFGSMEFTDTDVPQGNNIFYPVDYKAFVDTLYQYTEGAPSNLALKSDLASDKSELQGVDSELKNALGGTLRQCLCVKDTLDFDNTNVVDLGSLNWYYQAGGTRFFAIYSGIKLSPNNNTKPNIMCSKYKTGTPAETYNGLDKVISVPDSDSGVFVRDTNYTDATAFKAAMKNVLLAYEKAED